MRYADEGKSTTEKNTEGWSLFHYITDELYGVEDELENLRAANDALRCWGDDLESQAKKQDDVIYNLECEIENLKETA